MTNDSTISINLEAPPHESLKTICQAVSLIGSDMMSSMAATMAEQTDQEQEAIFADMLDKVGTMAAKIDKEVVALVNSNNIMLGLMVLSVLQTAVWSINRLVNEVEKDVEFGEEFAQDETTFPVLVRGRTHGEH